MYYAHRTEDERRETAAEHLQLTARLCQEFAAAFGAGAWGELLGLGHDVGKYSRAFQDHLLKGAPRVDHSTAGAKEVCAVAGLLAAYCVAGHHAGLPDGGSEASTARDSDLRGRLLRQGGREIPDYSAWAEEISLPRAPMPPLRPLGRGGFTASFFVRMLFSCLVDADFLATEAFMQGGRAQRGGYDDMRALWARMQRHIEGRMNPQSDINRKRCEILSACVAAGEGARGLYTLTVPTGGGKTESSLAFALAHAQRHGLSRGIYVIPYTNIIEQSAGTFAKIMGEGNVLTHCASVNYDAPEQGLDEKKAADLERKRLSTENWDAPLIVTTNVQFFESLFGNRTSRCRKLHNIANSVLVFDEAQMLPSKYLKPCARAIAELVQNYGCTAVLCTATQPSLGPFFPEHMQPVEICPDAAGLHRFFRRTQFQNLGKLDDQALAGRLQGHAQALCIVNSRRQAKNLFDLLPEEGCFYLTTLLYPNHRRKVLEAVRKRLKAGLPCRLIATSLVEAGVDLDFPAVYRALAGLDSIIQAAGRCNREAGRTLAESIVYIFEPEADYASHYWYALEESIAATKQVAPKYEDLSAPEAITEYFALLHHVRDLEKELDVLEAVRRFEDGLQDKGSFPFRTIAERFKLIDNQQKQVFVPWDDEAKKIEARLRSGERTRQLLRQAAAYEVGVYFNQWDALYDAGAIEPLDEEIALLTDLRLYSQHTGLALDVETGKGLFS